MSDRMKKIVEAGEALRQFDIELGAKQERERIISLVGHSLFNDVDHIPSLCEGCDFIARIKGETNE